MEKAAKTILVPWDFTMESEYAIQHAINISKAVGNSIHLIHIVKRKKFLEEATEKLNIAVSDIENKYGIKPNIIIKKGNIFKEIKRAADDLNSNLVIMGIHGDKSSRRMIKVIRGAAKVPFIVVQAPPTSNTYNEIVLPIDEDKKTRAEIKWVIYFSKYYKCNINIIKPFYNSDYKNESMKKNMYFVKNTLHSKDIVFGVRTAKRGIEYSDAIFSFAKEIDADMVLCMTNKYKDYILSAKDPENIKTRKKTPIMCINKRSDIAKLGSFN